MLELPAAARLGNACRHNEPSAQGATGKVYLPGRDPNSSGGHYEDTYVKTPDGWKFKSRKYLSAKEEAAAAQ